MNNATEMMTVINSEIDARIAYEKSKNASNENIVKTLNNVRKSVSHETLATLMIACNYDVASINRNERVNARRNVYSIEKDANILRFLAALESLNHYTLAIIKSALVLEANEMTLTHKDAASACSLDVKVDNAAREKLIKTCKYSKHIAANTASTQSSSSINALVAVNVLSEQADKSYKINRESEAFKLLNARLSA